MQYVNSQMIADAINELDTKFDAHEVERRVLRKQPIAFANELLRYAQSNDALRIQCAICEIRGRDHAWPDSSNRKGMQSKSGWT